MVKNIYFYLAAISLLASSLTNATFVRPASIEGTPQLGVPYQINWTPVVGSDTSNIDKVRLQFGNGDGLTNVNVLFEFATLPFPDTTSYTYTWPTNLTTTNANYTVVFEGLDAKSQVVGTEYIKWFHLSPAPVQGTPVQNSSASSGKDTSTAPAAPSPKSDAVRQNTLSVVGAFAFACFAIVATATI